MRTMVFFTFFPILAQAAEPLRVTWQQVPSVCSGRIALVRLTTDTRLEGRILSVAAASFDMEVERTSDKKAAPKGIRTLDRSALAELRGKRAAITVWRRRGTWADAERHRHEQSGSCFHPGKHAADAPALAA